MRPIQITMFSIFAAVTLLLALQVAMAVPNSP